MDHRLELSSKKIGIMYGGRSGEHEVSLLSATSVIRNTPTTTENIVLIGIDKEGIWHLQPADVVKKIREGDSATITTGHAVVVGIPGNGLHVLRENKLSPLPIDIVFPVLHGTFGEDGTVQGFLETIGVSYVGSGVLGSSLGMDKEKIKRVWAQNGLNVVPFKVIYKHQLLRKDIPRIYKDLTQTFGTTLFIKPARGGSSVGIGRTQSEVEFSKAIEHAFQFDTKILIEPAVKAREIEVSVIGNDKVKAFVPGEILPTHEFYDYDAKYIDPDGALLKVPADLTEQQIEIAKQTAIDAYVSAEASGLARVDFFLDVESGQLLLNEINTLPGFTDISMFPRLCEADGLAYPELISELLVLALQEADRRQSLQYRK